MRALRYLAIAALVALALVWSILFVAGLPGRLALVRDNGMEPTVPQGSVMIIIANRHSLQVGDVVAWWPNGTEYGTQHLGALLAVFDDARPARIAPRQGTVTITFDNRPDEAPLVVPPPGRVHGPMHGYIPFIGYLLWPGPVGLVLILIAALVVLYLTRQRRGPTTG